MLPRIVDRTAGTFTKFSPLSDVRNFSIWHMKYCSSLKPLVPAILSTVLDSSLRVLSKVISIKALEARTDNLEDIAIFCLAFCEVGTLNFYTSIFYVNLPELFFILSRNSRTLRDAFRTVTKISFFETWDANFTEITSPWSPLSYPRVSRTNKNMKKSERASERERERDLAWVVGKRVNFPKPSRGVKHGR